jgi:WD40 repeat protein
MDLIQAYFYLVINIFINKSYCVKTLSGHLDWVRHVSPSEDGKFLVTASNDQVNFQKYVYTYKKKGNLIIEFILCIRLLDFGILNLESVRWSLEVMSML